MRSRNRRLPVPPRLIDPVELTYAEGFARECRHQTFAVLGVGPSQWDQGLHRGLRTEFGATDRVLHALRKHLDKGPATADPAR